MLPTVDEKGEKPLGVSWSRLYTWEKCQQRAVFQMGGKGALVRDGRNFIHGTLADRAVRRFLDQENDHQPGQMATYIDELWDEHAVNSPEYKIKWRGDPQEDQEKVRNLAKKAVNNLEPFLFRQVLPYEYEAELRFRVPVRLPDREGNPRTIIMNGGMDIVTRDPETGLVSLYDLKATENEKYVQGGIMAQLIFYSVAWSFLMKTSPGDMRAAFLTPACQTQYHELIITTADRRMLMSRVVAFAQSIWAKDRPKLAEDKNECYFCECRNICPRWSGLTKQGSHRVSLRDSAARRVEAESV